MNTYEVRHGESAWNVAAQTPEQAATAVIRTIGASAWERISLSHPRYGASVTVVGHGKFGCEVEAFGVEIELAALMPTDVSMGLPPWLRPVVGEPWPWRACLAGTADSSPATGAISPAVASQREGA